MSFVLVIAASPAHTDPLCHTRWRRRQGARDCYNSSTALLTVGLTKAVENRGAIYDLQGKTPAGNQYPRGLPRYSFVLLLGLEKPESVDQDGGAEYPG